MYLGEIRRDVVDCIDLAQDRNLWHAVVNMSMNLRVPCKAAGFLTNTATVSFSRRTPPRGVSCSDRHFLHVLRLIPEAIF
jgi:hypothetical protein